MYINIISLINKLNTRPDFDFNIGFTCNEPTNLKVKQNYSIFTRENLLETPKISIQ